MLLETPGDDVRYFHALDRVNGDSRAVAVSCQLPAEASFEVPPCRRGPPWSSKRSIDAVECACGTARASRLMLPPPSPTWAVPHPSFRWRQTHG